MNATHGRVYRAFDADGELLYVGMSTQLSDRLKGHARSTPWWSLVARVENDAPLPLADAFRSECDQIIALRPRFNQNGGVAQWHGPCTPDPEAWRASYERGATIEEIALDAGTSTTVMRQALVDAGTVMRRPGQRVGTQARNRANERQSSSPPSSVRVAFAGTRGVHRRRGLKRAA